MDLEVVSVEAWRPLVAADLRANLRRLSTDEDTLLARFIESATRYVEMRTKMSLLGRTMRIYFPAWPTTAELPAPPLRYAADAEPATAITQVRYRNTAGVMTAAPADSLRPARGDQVWNLVRGAATLPETATHERAVEVTFTVGFRDPTHLAINAPDLVDAITLLASHRDSNREATIVETRVLNVSRKVEFGVDALLAPYIVRTRYLPAWQ